MGRPFTRLNNKVLSRIINRERDKKGYPPLDRGGATMAGTVKAAVPDFP